MGKYIKIGSNDELIKVHDIYAFTYDFGNGKTVLRITISPNEKSFEELYDLLSSGPMVSKWEEQEVTDSAIEPSLSSNEPIKEIKFVENYFNFCNDYRCEMTPEGLFEIELTKKFDIVMDIEANQLLTLDAYSAMAEVYEM